MSNYPDGLSEGTPDAPWNQRELDKRDLQCSVCGEEPGDLDKAEYEGPCQNIEPMFNDDGEAIPPCNGRYVLCDE